MNTKKPTKANAIGQLTRQEQLLRVLKQKYMLNLLYAINKDDVAAIAAGYEPGDKTDVKNEQGLKLGSVSMSNPSKKAVPDDDSVLLGYAVEHGHEVEDFLPEPGTPEYNAVIELVYSAGREEELLRPGVEKTVREEITAEVLENWEFTGNVPTGWSIKDASNPRFTVSLGRTAKSKLAMEHAMKPILDALPQTAFKELEG